MSDIVRAVCEERGVDISGSSNDASNARRVLTVCRERGPMDFARLADDWCFNSLPALFGMGGVSTSAEVIALADKIVAEAKRLNVPRNA